jgi:hypothetical protein
MSTTTARVGSRMLNILCLHGYGSNAAVFEYQSRLFRKTFAGSMSFHILQAPHVIDDQPPPPAFATRGLLPPFYGWYRIGQLRSNEQGQRELQVRCTRARLSDLRCRSGELLFSSSCTAPRLYVWSVSPLAGRARVFRHRGIHAAAREYFEDSRSL